MPLPKDSMFFGFAPKLTSEQKEYVDAIFDNQLIIVNAPSGTGKTTLAVAVAKMLGKDLLYIFTPVEEDKMGHRPGTQSEKEQAYIAPLKDALMEINENPEQVIFDEEMLETDSGKKKADIKKIRDGMWVFPKSHTFCRGTNIKGKTVIIDECQNFTVKELQKILTRIHDNCTVIMIGHTGQCDLAKPSKSGFEKYIEHFQGMPKVKVCELTVNFRGWLAQHADKIKD